MRGTYFLYCEGYVKIGFSKRIEQRIRDFQCGNPFIIKLLGVIKNQWKERELHKKFDYVRHIKEWFKINEYILDIIENNCDFIDNKFLVEIKDVIRERFDKETGY